MFFGDLFLTLNFGRVLKNQLCYLEKYKLGEDQITKEITEKQLSIEDKW